MKKLGISLKKTLKSLTMVMNKRPKLRSNLKHKKKRVRNCRTLSAVGILDQHG
jgi:hypothetical protein